MKHNLFKWLFNIFHPRVTPAKKNSQKPLRTSLGVQRLEDRDNPSAYFMINDASHGEGNAGDRIFNHAVTLSSSRIRLRPRLEPSYRSRAYRHHAGV